MAAFDKRLHQVEAQLAENENLLIKGSLSELNKDRSTGLSLELTPKPVQMIDYILRFENLESDMNRLMLAYNYTLRYSDNRVNGGKSSKKSPIMSVSDLDEETISLINTVYKYDFYFLGYTMLGPSNGGRK